MPLSADDGIIKRTIELKGIEILHLGRERIRVDGKLTNCENGDRILICKTFIEPLPKDSKVFEKFYGLFFSMTF